MNQLQDIAQAHREIFKQVRQDENEPALARQSHEGRRAAARELCDSLTSRVLRPFRELKRDEYTPADLLEAAEAIAWTGAHVAAVALAASEPFAASDLLGRLVSLDIRPPIRELMESASRAPDEFRLLMHARWMQIRGRYRPASRILRKLAAGSADPGIQNAAAGLRHSLQPVSGPPTLFTFNGIGTKLYGRRDPRPDGSYVATRYFCLLHIPVLPLGAYRVASREDGRYLILGRLGLGPVARIARYTVQVLLAIGITAFSVYLYRESPGHRLAVALERAQKIEAAGNTEAALAAYDEILRESSGEGTSKEPEQIAARIIRLQAQDLPEPFRSGDVERARGLVNRFEAMPPSARGSTPSTLLVGLLQRWAGQIGTKTSADAEAAIRLYEMAEKVSYSGSVGNLEKDLSAARRALALNLETEWPVRALHQYAGMGADPEAIRKAGKLLKELSREPLLLAECRSDAQSWLGHVAALPDWAPVAEEVRRSLARADELPRNQERAKALDSGNEGALLRALAREPADQEAMVALAALARARGDLKGAESLLTSGRTAGWLIRPAQFLLAACYHEEGRLEESAGILSSQLALRLPHFQEARQIYLDETRQAYQRLVDRANSGLLPGDLMRSLEGASREEQQRIFEEWAQGQMSSDRNLADLRERFVGFADVVSASTLLGTVKLRQAARADGQARQALLEEAERCFLSIRSEAEGDPAFHLGLGQVLHRLGRSEEAEKEFARVLSPGSPPELMLRAVEAYRELGLVGRAREVARELYDNHPEAKAAAAHYLALMAAGPDEREKWLRRSDTKSPLVQASILDAEGDRLYLQGKLAEADSKYSRVAEYYARTASHSPASANNAALAYRSRYMCTGEQDHLATATRYLEAAVRLSPENAIALSNLVEQLDYLADLRVLGRWIHTGELRLDANDTDFLIASLIAGNLREEVLAAYQEESVFQRSVQLNAQVEILSPRGVDAYFHELLLDYRARDLAALGRLRDRLREVGRVDATEFSRDYESWISGRDDGTRLESLKNSLGLWERRIPEIEKRGHLPTLSAALLVRSADLARKADIQGKTEDYREAVDLAKRALKIWPKWGIEGWIAGNLVEIAALEAMADSPDLRARWLKDRRRWSLHNAIRFLEAEPKTAPVIAAIRKRVETKEALVFLKAGRGDRPDLDDWTVAWLGQDPDAEKATRKAFSDEAIRLHVEIRSLMLPELADTRATREFLAKTR